MDQMPTVLVEISKYALAGVILSAIIEYTHHWLDTVKQKVFYSIVIALAGGIVVYGLRFIPGNIIQVIAGVFAAASAVYSVIFNGAFPAAQSKPPDTTGIQ
jgi:hypothetical protein